MFWKGEWKQLFFFTHCTNYTTASPKYSTTNTWSTFSKSWTTLGSISPSWSQTWCQQLGNGSEIRWRILTSRKEKLKRIYETIYKPQKPFTWMQPSLLERSTVSNTRLSCFFFFYFEHLQHVVTKSGLSLRSGDQGFPPATFVGKRKKNRSKRNP